MFDHCFGTRTLCGPWKTGREAEECALLEANQFARRRCLCHPIMADVKEKNKEHNAMSLAMTIPDNGCLLFRYNSCVRDGDCVVDEKILGSAINCYN